ncbi:MAG: dipeptidase [Gemmatimonas sp.]|jgi:membrane dipeptidase|uniref:dipeptidase n=1 Tax=Gemmatimonas sp. TaxID=1962908 RepID=UPI0022C04DDD|nr:dipeptidase [Gemmatimonas sp.]MCE2952084.1 dipeptidase [Gemmatimonas sp.]MCZ8012759.1 dipeptidase [Gemmatimonas sp.]MCZ8268767.1 dipeptidase [Gemmatimonas sp.]
MSAFARRCLLAPALPLAAVLCLTPSLSAQSGPKPRDEAAVLAAAKAIHAKVLSIDTHVDIAPSNFTATGPNYTQRLPRTQVDLVKMEEGGLVGAFLIVYVGQDTALNAAGYARANAQAIEKFEAIHRLTETLAPSRAEIAYTAADARRIHQSGKRVIFIGIENGFPIGSDLSNVQKFYERGGRYLSLAHNGHSQLSDSNTGERDGVWLHNGLSPLGRQVIAEMNRLGMMIDVSHPSKQSMLQTVALSTAPIIASHSGARALCGHSRNMDDEQLDALKKNGGVIQLVAFNSYVKCNPTRDAERAAAIDALRKEYGIAAGNRAEVQRAMDALPNDRRNAYLAKQEDITARRYPADPAATVKDFADHIDYVVKRIGIDHVGISSDFDGGGGVDGWRTASESLNVTAELVRRGYTEQEIAKIWGGNLLRVMERVEKVAGK